MRHGWQVHRLVRKGLAHCWAQLESRIAFCAEILQQTDCGLDAHSMVCSAAMGDLLDEEIDAGCMGTYVCHISTYPYIHTSLLQMPTPTPSHAGGAMGWVGALFEARIYDIYDMYIYIYM